MHVIRLFVTFVVKKHPVVNRSERQSEGVSLGFVPQPNLLFT